MSKRLILLLVLLGAGCARRALVPVVQAPTPSFKRTAPTTGAIVQFPERRERRIGIEAVTQRARLHLAFLPVGLGYDTHGLEILRAAGFEGLNYWPSLDFTTTAALDRASELGLKIDFAWQASIETIDWIKTNTQDFPNRQQAIGVFAVAPDEPNPTTCPTGSVCYQNIQNLYAYAGVQLPWLRRSVTLSAFAAFCPTCFGRWAKFAEPYYLYSDVAIGDYYPYCWYGGDYTINATLIANTRQFSGKPVIWYSDGAGLEASQICNNGPYPIPSNWLVNAFNSDNSASPEVVIWWFTPGAANEMRFAPVKDGNWLNAVAAADSLTQPPNDCNADGRVDLNDLALANEAGNAALAARINAVLRRVYLPMVMKP